MQLLINANSKVKMNLQNTLDVQVKTAVKTLFKAELESVEFQATRKEFAGDITVVDISNVSRCKRQSCSNW